MLVEAEGSQLFFPTPVGGGSFGYKRRIPHCHLITWLRRGEGLAMVSLQNFRKDLHPYAKKMAH
jgi:hypothetical protein